MTDILHIEDISQVHHMLGLGKPRHPLVSLIKIDDTVANFNYGNLTYTFGFYQVAFKSGIKGDITYGRSHYDFADGSMVCTMPGQAMAFKDVEDVGTGRGWVLLFHPDLVRRSELGRDIHDYSFFHYEIHEALHLSELEIDTLTEIVNKIKGEYEYTIDRHSQKLIVANIELLLDYTLRYYDRQFYVRTNQSQDFISRFENFARNHYESGKALQEGALTVKQCADQLNMSASYLSDMLKKETGRTAQQHLHELVIDKAKNLLLGSNEQVSQIAYELGFEYPQHFSKLFKKQVGVSPAEYRKAS